MDGERSRVSIGEGDLRLLELAKTHRSDAALAVQLGLPTGDTQRRLDHLCQVLGVEDRRALRDVDFATIEVRPAAQEPGSVTPAALIERAPMRGTEPLATTGSSTSTPGLRVHTGRHTYLKVLTAAGVLLAVLAFVAVRASEHRESPPSPVAVEQRQPQGATVAPVIASLATPAPSPSGVAVVSIVTTEDGRQVLARRRQGAGGASFTEELLALEPGDVVTSVLPVADGAELWATVCRGCADRDTVWTQVLRSRDGGTTWSTAAQLEGHGGIAWADAKSVVVEFGTPGGSMQVAVPVKRTATRQSMPAASRDAPAEGDGEVVVAVEFDAAVYGVAR